MKKILIIAYFYPPCNLTAANRVYAWAKYLHKSGFRPIIITRNWDIHINVPEDSLLSTGQKIQIEKFEEYEVHYLPYHASIRDRVFAANRENRWIQQLSKLFTLIDVIGENFSNRFIPFANLYDYALNILKKDTDIKLLMVSGNPFVQFRFGYLLNKKLGIKWIADYRDAWYTQELSAKRKGINWLIAQLQAFSEKKWIKSACCITSVSDLYTNRISAFVNKPGHTIMNGYHDVDLFPDAQPDKTKFTLVYNGSLFDSQPIEPFINAIRRLLADSAIQLKIEVIFPGINYDMAQTKRVSKLIEGFTEAFILLDRLPHDRVIELQKKADLLLMFAYGNMKGIPSSKLYEYIGLRKPIVLYPNDHDIIEQTLKEVGCGYICQSEAELFELLKSLILAKQNNNSIRLVINEEAVAKYSREQQTAKLARLLSSVIEN